MSQQQLDPANFVQFLLAELVTKDITAFHVRDRGDERALMRLLNFFIDEIEHYSDKDDHPVDYKTLVRLRNSIAPSRIGSFEGFESILRYMQYWLTSSRNPELEIMKFDFPKSRAKNLLDQMDDNSRRFVEGASKALLEKDDTNNSI